MSDLLKLLGIAVFISALGQFVLSLLFCKLVGLRSTPDRRARLTALSCFIVSCAFSPLLFAPLLSEQSIWWIVLAPLAGVPGAMAVYLFYRAEFRKHWIDDDAIPDGMKIENNDWRIALYGIAAVAFVALIRVLALKAVGVMK